MAERDESKQLLTDKEGKVPNYSPPPPQVQFYPVQTVAQPIKYGYVERPPQPPDHVGLAIFSMVCCFWPLGIMALVFSFRSRYKYIDGDFAGAKEYSSRARNMARLAILVGIVVVVCIVLLEIFAVGVPLAVSLSLTVGKNTTASTPVYN